MRQIVKYVKLLYVINQKAALIDEIFGVPRFKQQDGNYRVIYEPKEFQLATWTL